MKPVALSMSFAILAAASLALSPARAEDRVYRCGNEYTNQIKGRTDCKPVEGGNVTVVRGLAPAAVPASSSAGPHGADAPAVARADSPEQRARDADAKAILQQELERAQARQDELLKQYNDDGTDKTAGSQKHLEMKAAIDRNQSDIDGIKRELARFK
jgi:hypothetical protein